MTILQKTFRRICHSSISLRVLPIGLLLCFAAAGCSRTVAPIPSVTSDQDATVTSPDTQPSDSTKVVASTERKPGGDVAADSTEAEDRDAQAVVWMGGSITRDDKAEGKPVVGVNLSETQVRDAGLKELKDLKNLQWLDLRWTSVTDAGLKELKDLKNLKFLNLRQTQVTDAGLKELKDLKNLQGLDLVTPE